MVAFSQILQETLGSGLLLHEILHGVVAVPLAFWLWKKTKSKKLIITYFLIVYFLDIDHLFDYWIQDGVSFDIVRFLSTDYFRENNQALVAFHGWEYVALFGYLGYIRKWKTVFAAIALAMISHLAWDAIAIESVSFYSAIYRILTNFALPN